MIPPIMTSVTTMPTPKAKIGFSIESIVGERESSKSPSRDDSYRLQDYHREISTALRIPHFSPIELKSPTSPATDLRTFREENHLQTPSPPIRATEHIHASTGSPGVEHLHGAIHRPFPMVPPNYEHSPPPPQPPPQSQQMGSPFGMQMHPQHLLATQFQMAAALAQQQMQQGFAPAGHMQPPPHLMNSMPRDSYPLYPWLLSRHGRVFPPAVLGNFLLHPFRKPKRVRTAFSPNQLLKLEHAFEANQYVVGAERKALAKSLNLSETQVKVWFQNRRTKHKRMQQEDAEPGKSGSNQGSYSHNDDHSSDEDELIDLEMDDCPSEEDIDSKTPMSHPYAV